MELSRELPGESAARDKDEEDDGTEQRKKQSNRDNRCFTSWPILSSVLNRLLKSMITKGFHMGGKELWNG